MNDHDNDTTLIQDNKDTPPLADELQPIADNEGGRRTTTPRVIQSARRTQAFAAGGDPGKMRAADADRDRVVERLNIAYSEGRLSKDEHNGRLEPVAPFRVAGVKGFRLNPTLARYVKSKLGSLEP